MPIRMQSTAALLLTSLLAGCASAESWVELKGHRYRVEVADAHEERARGLMFRDRLDADRGMLFLFAQPEPQSFWMKNTRIPLDILYFDAGRRLVSAARRTPPCSLGDRCPGYPSAGPSQYVLELNAGQADELRVQVGDELVFGPNIPSVGSP